MLPFRAPTKRPIASYLSQADRDDEDNAPLLAPGPLEPTQRSKQLRPRLRLTRRVLILLSTIITLIAVFCIAMFLVRGQPDARSKDAPFYPSPLPIEHRVAPFDFSSNASLVEIQQELDYRLSFGPEGPSTLECTFQYAGGLFGDEVRYGYLRDQGPVLVSINLYNNQAVFPTLARNLLQLADFLGRSNVHIAIFENGSKDWTPIYMAHLAAALTAARVPHTISSEHQATDWRNVDRIEQLAVYRNVVLEPLHTEGAPRYETVLFVNDVFHCRGNLLELFHQRIFQKAHGACGLDWTGPLGNPRFYDNWVTRSLTGRSIRPRFDPLRSWKDGLKDLFRAPIEKQYLARYKQALPIPVYSCWNGMIALDARPFRGERLPEDNFPLDPPPTLSDASSPPHLDESPPQQPPAEEMENPERRKMLPHYGELEEPVIFRGADRESGECEASECKLVAKDFWRRGFGRFVLVPSVHSTYVEDLWSDASLLKTMRSVRNVRPDEERIDWEPVRAPKKVICWPWTSRPHLDWIWLRAAWEDAI